MHQVVGTPINRGNGPKALLWILKVGPRLELGQHKWPRKKCGKIRRGRANYQVARTIRSRSCNYLEVAKWVAMMEGMPL